jgi:hypothetical protein
MAGIAVVVLYVTTHSFQVATPPVAKHLRRSDATLGGNRPTPEIEVAQVVQIPPQEQIPRVVLLVHPSHYFRKDQFLIDYGNTIGAAERVDCATGSYHPKVPSIVVMDLGCFSFLGNPSNGGFVNNPLVKIVMLDHEIRIAEQPWMSKAALDDVRQHKQSYLDKLENNLFYGADVLGLAYGYETTEAQKVADTLKEKPAHKGRKVAEIVHNPHCTADKYFNGGVGLRPRHGAIAIGHSFSLYYPLRHRIRGILAASKSQLGGAREANFWDMNTSGVAQKQQQDYVNTLHSSKICIFDSSTFKYTVMKFYEAAAAGCLIMADRPSDLVEELDKFVVWIDMEMSDETISSKIQWWLEHDAERETRAREGVLFARRHSCRAHFSKLSEVAMRTLPRTLPKQ